jgi:hypothetical protein
MSYSSGSSRKKVDVTKPPGPQLLITAGIVGLLSLGTTYCGVDSVRTAVDMRSWKSTKGRIIKVRTSESGSGTEVRAAVGVIYTFQVNGKTYQGNKVSPGEEWNTFTHTRDAEREVARLRANPEVTVYYNPSKPSESALDQVWDGLIIYLVVSWLVTFVLWLTVILVIRAHRRRKRAHEQWKAREGAGPPGASASAEGASG